MPNSFKDKDLTAEYKAKPETQLVLRGIRAIAGYTTVARGKMREVKGSKKAKDVMRNKIVKIYHQYQAPFLSLVLKDVAGRAQCIEKITSLDFLSHAQGQEAANKITAEHWGIPEKASFALFLDETGNTLIKDTLQVTREDD